MRLGIRSSAVGMLGLLLSASFIVPASAGLAEADWTLGGVDCSLISVETANATPVGRAPCPGVRPGASLSSVGGGCSFNFLFLGSDGNRYMGSAGHCILDSGETTWAAGTGPEVFDADGQRVGEYAYAILEDPKDFSLIRLDPGVEASAQMCHFGGPTGTNSDLTNARTLLHHFGNGIGTGETLPARSAVAFGLPDPDHVYAAGLVTFGDSGSGVISEDGRAIGVAVTTGLHLASIGTQAIDSGTMGITRLAPQVEQARQALGLTSLTLQTAPLL